MQLSMAAIAASSEIENTLFKARVSSCDALALHSLERLDLVGALRAVDGAKRPMYRELLVGQRVIAVALTAEGLDVLPFGQRLAGFRGAIGCDVGHEQEPSAGGAGWFCGGAASDDHQRERRHAEELHGPCCTAR
jgi:hypothetical protein